MMTFVKIVPFSMFILLMTLYNVQSDSAECGLLMVMIRHLEVRVKEMETALEKKHPNAFCKTLSKEVCGSCQCVDAAHNPNRYVCDCTSLPPRRDCRQFYDDGVRVDGKYIINSKAKMMVVACDMSTTPGGWTVFQRRLDESVNFFRDWKSYKEGFGDVNNNFWLGNENLNALSEDGKNNELRVDMTSFDHVSKYAVYKDFHVGTEKERYKMTRGAYSGTAGDSFPPSKTLFGTYDNDVNGCAKRYASGWWYTACHGSHLNGVYFYSYQKKPNTDLGIDWSTEFGNRNSLKTVEMKIRRTI